MKFLIDECLSLSLAELAIEAGYPGSAHVNYRGMRQDKDWVLMEKILAQDWTFATRNSDDFRPRSGSASKAPCYLGVELHAGLVCLNLPMNSRKADHELYFRVALSVLTHPDDLTNRILEVSQGRRGKLSVSIMEFPSA